MGSALSISKAHQKNVDFVGALYQFYLMFGYEINKNVIKYDAIYKFLVKRENSKNCGIRNENIMDRIKFLGT